ncbi:hypothetical protein L596_017883 [Steinernema carpocapsae]|uniref:C2H2-type domain-containing protein n=1 Tax=Steinernema carpocapsae TaxID=34508 RepID=A0A4U5N3A4_STECR|nr:hypothetical protein L596_017883 [Steinernema carpocapsae]
MPGSRINIALIEVPTDDFDNLDWTTCHHCPQTFLTDEDLREHEILEHPLLKRIPTAPGSPRSIACDFCATTFSDNLRLFRHQEYVHFRSMKHVMSTEFKCITCCQRFTNLTAFEKHSAEERHTSWVYTLLSVCRMFECRFCPRSFTKFSLLQSHQRIQHRVIGREVNGRITYETAKANRRSRLEFYPARPRGRPPKVRVQEVVAISSTEEDHLESKPEDESRNEETETESSPPRKEIQGFGCPYCDFFDQNYERVSHHITDHYQQIVTRQQQKLPEEPPPKGVEVEKEDQTTAIELNSEVITLLDKDRSFIDDLHDWFEEA